jgi:putative membrane protein
MIKAFLPFAAVVAMGAAATMPVEILVNDKQVVAALKEINDHEIEMAEMADDKATRADVKEFAAMMKREHEQMNDQLDELDDLEGDEDATPLVDELERAHEQERDMLDRLDSAGFDAAFMKAMVEGHRKVLDMIDNKFMATATSPALRTQLQGARTKVDAHLRQAGRISEGLGTGMNRGMMPRDTARRDTSATRRP